MDVQKPSKQSHKLWRKNAKKLQRKRRRRLAAVKREEDLKLRQQSPTYQTQEANERALELFELENIRQMNEIEHNKWLESEIQIEQKWKEQQLKIEEQTRKAEEERRRIQNEFEAQQKRIEQAIEEKKRLLEEQREREIDLDRRIQAFIDGVDEMPPELLVEAETNPGKGLCPFFANTATCRFGNKCMHNHKRQKIGKILQVPAFFSNICLDQNKDTEYGSDLVLEHDEKEIYENFAEFFVDVVPEFERFGEILHFVACKNSAAHLRGYVYIEYSTEKDALKAQRALHGRYYAGRMLNVEFCAISWKSAVCGSALKNNCRKGRICNFLHIFKNPSDLFSIERTLRESSKRVINSQRNQLVQNDNKDDWSFNGERNKRNWRWSESPIKEIMAKNAENLGTKVHGMRHKSRRSRSRSQNRDKTGSRSKSRSESKSSSRSQSGSRHHHHHHKRKTKRSHSPSHKKRSKKSKTRSPSHSQKKKRRRSRSKETTTKTLKH